MERGDPEAQPIPAGDFKLHFPAFWKKHQGNGMGELREEFPRIAIPIPEVLAGKTSRIQPKLGCFHEKGRRNPAGKAPKAPKIPIQASPLSPVSSQGAPSAPESRLESAGKSQLPSPRAGARPKNIPRNFLGSPRKSWNGSRTRPGKELSWSL